jgi:hypothetical protein
MSQRRHGRVGSGPTAALWVLGASAFLATTSAPADADNLVVGLGEPPVVLAQDVPPPPQPAPIGAPAGPPSLGQQPLPTEQPADETPSQGNTNQFNQLFQFETTPDVCAAGEGYLSGQFNYLKFPGAVREYRYQIQGQYGITDQIAAGVYIPVVHADFQGNHAGTGDVGIYGQYKFDKFINPEIVDVTGQLDVILPTGSTSQLRDTGHFGIRPLALAYKDFGQQGPGTLGVYGLLGFTVTTNSDFRVGLAASYEIHRLAGVVEFFDTTGNRLGRPLVSITPGLVYRGLGPLEAAIGVPLGVNNGSPRYGVTFKLTYDFAK